MKTSKSDLLDIAMLISHPHIPNDPQVFTFLKFGSFFYSPILKRKAAENWTAAKMSDASEVFGCEILLNDSWAGGFQVWVHASIRKSDSIQNSAKNHTHTEQSGDGKLSQHALVQLTCHVRTKIQWMCSVYLISALLHIWGSLTAVDTPVLLRTQNLKSTHSAFILNCHRVAVPRSWDLASSAG